MLITATGWTWEYIDRFMTLPRLEQLTKTWMEYPPTHISVAGIVHGLAGKKPQAPRAVDDDGLPEDLRGTADLAPVVGDNFELRQMRVVNIDARKQ
jgi:hypothetical protein